MKRIPTRSLRTGDKVLFRDAVYVAVELDHEECWTECSCYDPLTKTCSAACYRFRDLPPVTLRYLKPRAELTFNEKVCVSLNDMTKESEYEPKLPWT